MLCDDILAGQGVYRERIRWVCAEVRKRRAAGQDLPEQVLQWDRVPEDDEGTSGIYEPIRTAQRFVLSPLIVQAAQDLADQKAVERSRDQLFLPAEKTWLEWEPPRGGRVGVLMCGTPIDSPDAPKAVVLGTASAFSKGAFLGNGDWLHAVRFGTFCFPDVAKPVFEFDVERNRDDGLPNDASHWKSFGCFICAALALINTPRVVSLETFEHQKLNHHRARKNRPALLSWTQVTISPDIWGGKTQQLARTEARAFHHVRAHLRLRRGRVQIVRPHWRGDPRYGIRLHRYAVRRIEDERGLWEGGVLPMPSILP